MKAASATEVKNRFGRYLEAALLEPVVIEKSGRPVAVLLGFEDYVYLDRLDDAHWSARADIAMAEPTIGREESMKYIRRYLEMVEDAEA